MHQTPYFKDIEWMAHNHMPQCMIWVDKRFDAYYCLNYAHSGTIIWKDEEGAETTLRAPLAWWTYPGPRFQYGSLHGTPWDQRFVNFRGNRVDAYIESGLLPIRASVPSFREIANPLAFSRAFDRLFDQIESRRPSFQRAIHTLEDLLLQLHEQPSCYEGSSGIETKIQTLVQRIEENPERPWNMRQEAARIGLSYTHMRRNFQLVSGFSPQRYITVQRMRKAASALRSSSVSIKRIASQCGYEDVYYFTRVFAKHYRLPPGEYRKRARME